MFQIGEQIMFFIARLQHDVLDVIVFEILFCANDENHMEIRIKHETSGATVQHMCLGHVPNW